MKRKSYVTILLIVTLGLLWPANALAEFAAPAGFVDQQVVGGVPAPTAIDWLPNGDLLVATQGGVLFRWNGGGAAQLVLNLSGRVCATGEMGLLGLAVDPAFSGNGFIYLYYTRAGAGGDCGSANRANRVSRFTVDGSGAIGGETILIDNIAAPGSNHNAGDLQFDRNNLLYVSVGDGGSTPETARRLDTLNGKILRITRDGGIPAGNPFQDSGTTERCNSAGRSPSGKTCREIYATGLRNPFRIAFDPDDTSGQQFFINDVGGGAWEEIDAGAPGADYGWNIREGPCVRGSTTNCPQPSGFVEPIHAYAHGTGCRTITGGAFVPNAAGWPGGLADDYLFADLACDTLFTLDTATRAVSQFATGAGAVHLRFHRDGALYYTTYANGGQVRRIVAESSPPSPGDGTSTAPPGNGTSTPPPIGGSLSTSPADDSRVTCKKAKDKKRSGKHGKNKKGKDKKNTCKKGKHKGDGGKKGNRHNKRG